MQRLQQQQQFTTSWTQGWGTTIITPCAKCIARIKRLSWSAVSVPPWWRVASIKTVRIHTTIRVQFSFRLWGHSLNPRFHSEHFDWTQLRGKRGRTTWTPSDGLGCGALVWIVDACESTSRETRPWVALGLDHRPRKTEKTSCTSPNPSPLVLGMESCHGANANAIPDSWTELGELVC